jgi:hypothetical protein
MIFTGQHGVSNHRPIEIVIEASLIDPAPYVKVNKQLSSPSVWLLRPVMLWTHFLLPLLFCIFGLHVQPIAAAPSEPAPPPVPPDSPPLYDPPDSPTPDSPLPLYSPSMDCIDESSFVEDNSAYYDEACGTEWDRENNVCSM